MLVSISEASAWVGTTAAEIAALAASAPFGTVVRSWHGRLGKAIPRVLGDVANQTEEIDGPPAVRTLVSGGGSPDIDQHIVRLRQRIAYADLVSVKNRTSATGSWAALADDLTDYEVDQPPSRRLRRLSAAWPLGVKHLQIVYSGGFADDAAESGLDEHALQIKHLLLQLIELAWSRKSRGGGDVRSGDGMGFDLRTPFEIFRSDLADVREIAA